jgi:hypothetical protein
MQTTLTPAEPTTTGRPLPAPRPSCLCGARPGRGQTQCRKCRARERWHRRNRLDAENRRRSDAHRAAALLTGGAR